MFSMCLGKALIGFVFRKLDVKDEDVFSKVLNGKFSIQILEAALESSPLPLQLQLFCMCFL